MFIMNMGTGKRARLAVAEQLVDLFDGKGHGQNSRPGNAWATVVWSSTVSNTRMSTLKPRPRSVVRPSGCQRDLSGEPDASLFTE